MENEITIAIVDDEILFRKSITYILSREQNFRVIFEGGNGAEILRFLENNEQHPDILLMDIRMPVLDGVETAKIISERFPDIKTIILSSINSSHFIELMIKYGASSYLLKDSLPQQVVHAINRVYEDGIYFKPEMINIMINTKEGKTCSENQLSEREVQILQLICLQLNAKEIGDKLCLSERTVEGHRKRMLAKTKSKNVVGLILWGMKNNIILVDY